MTNDKINDLKQALELCPTNNTLRQLLAEAYIDEGEGFTAFEHYKVMFANDGIDNNLLVDLANEAIDYNQTEFAKKLLQKAISSGVVEGVKELQDFFNKNEKNNGIIHLVPKKNNHPIEIKEQCSFIDVGGLSEIKKVIHRMIILPNSRPDLLAKYGRKAGGGVLFYGPPGCGKTLLAKATAGECNLPFFNIRIEDILDPYIGVSESNLHEAFEQARRNSPCVLFLDEIDALAYSRNRQSGDTMRILVDQLLQELDSIGSENTGILILAATNVPWDLDDAIVRPGRFDRNIFVPPPDLLARESILKLKLKDFFIDHKHLSIIAKETPLFSGADLNALTQRAIDKVIDEALETNTEPPLENKHLLESLREITPSTLNWLSKAKNYVEFSNKSRKYDDVDNYLKSKEVKKYRL
ncbi:MAG: AAA family ATPase [Candidatus Cloacimonadota bacterium]|nr:MAG: AAA family ATPase [Candidatus Cloacimonadota bacterium]